MKRSTDGRNDPLGFGRAYLKNFDVDDCLRLLLNAREEKFPYERCIRLFQFQTWIWYPSERGIAPRAAGRLAAAAILREIEQDRFGKNIPLSSLQILSQSDKYRKIFDALIAPHGGWSALLMADEVDPTEFNTRIRAQTGRRAEIIADLIEYRLRAVNHPPTGPDRSKITHAIFFNWWPNRRSFTTRIAFHWWKRVKRTAAFIYLIEKRGFPMKPPSVDEEFCKRLKHPAISSIRLKKFFSEYAFVTGSLEEEDCYALPEHVTPVGFRVRRFSHDELTIIRAYAEHCNEMGDAKPKTTPGEATPHIARERARGDWREIS